MKRDFTQPTQNRLKLLLNEIDREWPPFTDGLSSRDKFILDSSGAFKTLNATNSYQFSVLETNKISVNQLQKIFDEVYEVDTAYAAKFKYHTEQLKNTHDRINSKTGFVISKSNYACSTAGNRDMVLQFGVFNGRGQYGGDQSDPINHFKDMAPVIRRYFPNMSDKEIKGMLKVIQDSGCGYVALCNTLFDQYIGREDEFYETFGIPMMVNGEFNYDALIADFAASTRKDFDDFLPVGGTDPAQREMYWERYLDDRGVKVDVKFTDAVVTIDNYYSYAKDGLIIIAVNPTIIYDEKGRRIECGGHAMTITGVKDGKFTVSSWGHEYYLDPKDIPKNGDGKFVQFQQVIFGKN